MGVEQVYVAKIATATTPGELVARVKARNPDIQWSVELCDAALGGMVPRYKVLIDRQAHPKDAPQQDVWPRIRKALDASTNRRTDDDVLILFGT